MSSKAGMATAGGAFFTRHFPTFLGWTGNLGWPILLKQLRTEFRRNRFFYSHFACLACLGAALIFLILTLTGSQPNVTPTQVGQGIFDWFLRIQSLVVLIIFPLFSATAFTEERANLTLDLLLISRLRPAEIVWGKLLASTIYCLMHVMATLPLLAISFLFGGVTVDEVLLAYALLAGGTLLISMASLCISSLFSRSLASTLCVYTLLVAGLIAAWYFYPQTEDSAGKATGEVLLTGLLRAWNPGGELKWLHVTVWFADATAVFCFLFLVTANRIRPPADDRTSLLRCLTLTYFPLRVAAGFFLRFPSIVVQSAVPLAARIAADMQALILWSALFLLLATVAFSTEDADVSPRCRKQFRPLTGPLYPLRLLAPGGFWGFIFSVVLGSAVCGLLYGLFVRYLEGGASAETRELVAQSLLALPILLAAAGALGFLLSAFGFPPLASRLTIIFTCFIVTLFPKILELSGQPDSLLVGYYLSPLLLWESIGRSAYQVSMGGPRLELWGVANIHIAKGVYLALALLMAGLAVLVARRAGLPLLRYGPEPPPSPAAE